MQFNLIIFGQTVVGYFLNENNSLTYVLFSIVSCSYKDNIKVIQWQEVHVQKYF